MPWDHDSWRRFLDTAVEIATGRRHDWRNSFLLYPYDPAVEKESMVHVHNARSEIGGGVTTQVISWGAYVADFLRRQGFLRLGVRDSEDRERLQQNLATQLPEALADRTCADLQGRARTHVVFIVRTGALFPFATISQTLAFCEQRDIRATLAILGPGHVADQGRSFGLLTGTPHPGYPALIVGPALES